MRQPVYILIAALLCGVISSCTSARWTVKEKSAVDESQYTVLQQDNFLKQAGEVTPQNPTLQLDLFSKTKYEYTQRVLMQRNIQDYKLRPGFLALGLGGAAAAFYTANSSRFRGSGSSTKSFTLNVLGVLLGTAGFLNMKPVGEPRPTGEERYLRNTGMTVKTDTTSVTGNIDSTASVTVTHNGELIYEDQNREITDGGVEISLAGKLNDLGLSGPTPGSVSISVVFEDSTYNYGYSVRDILLPYARVTSQLTELRNSPDITPDNVLADLVEGSQLQIQRTDDEQWYQVLYGISENYIRKEDAEIVWRPADFLDDNEVVTVPRVPFGNIDVESNIPILRGSTSNAVALIITNENYTGDLEEQNLAHRDGRLMKVYLTEALGYPKENIYELNDINSPNEIYRMLSEIEFAANNNTELFVYMSGYGAVRSKDGEQQLDLLGISDDDTTRPDIPLRNLFEQIASISSSKTIVVSDIDFSKTTSLNQFTANEALDIVESTAAPIANNERAALLMGARLSYPSSLYVTSGGEDKKHHIFPYFFAKALQQRMTRISEIYQYLERNVSYTSRKLFDRPQDPLLIGNSSLDLITQ